MRSHRSPVLDALRRLGTFAVFLSCCGFVVICTRPIYYRDGARAGFEFRLVVGNDRKGPRDYFYRLQSRREGGATVAIAPFFIYPGPFSFEGRGGISDLGLVGASSDAVACFELFERGHFADPAYTVDFCGRYVSGGYQVFSSENQDQRFYPGVYVLDFRIEYDGSQIRYLVREPGAQTWDLVTSVPLDYDSPLIPAMGARGFHRGGVYDLEELTWTATPPANPTAEQRFGWHVQESFRFDLSALERLEGAAPDFAGATNDFGLSRAQLQLALDQAPDFLDAKVGKQAVRYVVRADERLDGAQRDAADWDANGAVTNLFRSLRDKGRAVQRVYGLDFRGEF